MMVPSNFEFSMKVHLLKNRFCVYRMGMLWRCLASNLRSFFIATTDHFYLAIEDYSYCQYFRLYYI
jgi:hypothetical protein